MDCCLAGDQGSSRFWLESQLVAQDLIIINHFKKGLI